MFAPIRCPSAIRAYDRQGLMGDITTLLTGENVNIVDVQVGIARTWLTCAS